MANKYAGKTKPVRKSVGFSRGEWLAIRKWIAAQRPKISESEGLRQLVELGLEKLDDLAAEPWEPGEQIWEPGGGSYTTERPPRRSGMRQESERAAK